MHLRVFTKCQMLCNAYDDMSGFSILNTRGVTPGHRAKWRPTPISWARPTPPLRGRARRSLSFSPRARPSPPHRRRARRRLALSPRARQSYLQRHRARRNQTPVIRTRDVTAPLSVQKFLTFGGYWFHLLGYPGIRSPTLS